MHLAPPSSIYTDMNKMSYSSQHQAYPVQESYYTPQSRRLIFCSIQSFHMNEYLFSDPLPPAYGGYPTNAYTPYSQATVKPFVLYVNDFFIAKFIIVWTKCVSANTYKSGTVCIRKISSFTIRLCIDSSSLRVCV